MKRMKYEDFTPTTRKAIAAIAAERGTTSEAVVARFEELYAGKPSKNGRGIFAPA